MLPKKLWNVLLSVFLISVISISQSIPQEYWDASVSDAVNKFRNPPSEYGLTLWWGWDGPMTEEVIIRDLDDISRRGITCVMIEAGYGMNAPYLSPGWFELVKLAVEQAKQRGMHVWLVDEGKYPSGFAGGKFSVERPDLRMQGIVVAERIKAASGQEISLDLSPATVSAAAVNLADSSSLVVNINDGKLQWTAPEGEWEILLVEHQFRTSVTRAVNNPTRGKDASNSLCDYLNPAATKQFIAFTHEQYKKYVGKEFGTTVLGFRGDEPDFAYTPWTPRLPDEFESRKGYDVRPYLALFFTPRLSDEIKRVKADYWDVWSDMFRDNFFTVLADWCAENNLKYFVHLNHEDKMPWLVRSEGDFFKDQRHVQIPGIDTIWGQIWPGKVSDFPKLASSAAHLFGKPRAFSESFAAYRPSPNVEQAKWVIDQQFVRGINMLEVMFFPSSTNPQNRTGWMETEEFPHVVRYVHHATCLLSLGRPAAQIGIYYPTSSLWLGEDEADSVTWCVAQQMLESQRDFDFVDEQALSSVMVLQDGAFVNLSGQEYRCIIIPAAVAISKPALQRLQAFAASGGSVIFLGRQPALIVDKTFLKAAEPEDLTWVLIEPSAELTPRVLDALPPAEVRFDSPCPSVKYLHRRLKDADLYFMFNESTEQQSHRVSLAGSGEVQVWKAETGEIKSLPSDNSTDGTVNVSIELEPYETKFLLIGAKLPDPGMSRD
jgi:hypothetical protein